MAAKNFKLSQRHIELFKLLADGYSNEMSAKALSLGVDAINKQVRAVKTHLAKPTIAGCIVEMLTQRKIKLRKISDDAEEISRKYRKDNI